MRRTTVLLVIVLVHAGFAGYSQITLKERNVPLATVLAAIEKQTKYVFLYDPDELNMGPIIISIKNATLEKVLEKIFKDRQIEFTVVANNVLLRKKRPENNITLITEVDVPGKVVDENGQPLAGVTVIDKRKNKGTETDTSGMFLILSAKGDILLFSFVGLKGKEIRIAGQPSINIVLEADPVSPDQVVVIGYGSSKRKDLTGAVSTVDMKNMEEIPFNTVDNALAGKAAGVQVTKADGTPGGMVRVRIRGSSSLLGGNDPLYVIDGIPVQVRSNFINPGYSVGNTPSFIAEANGGTAIQASFVNGLNSLGALNPDDIESITVLKDASSTAIYGSKASNGVVIITTKTGKTNTPPAVTASYYSTVASPYKTPKLLNTSQYKTLLTEAAQNAFDEDVSLGYTPDPVTMGVLDSASTFFGTANTNWIKQVTRTTLSRNAGLSVSGGGQASKYFVSLSYGNTPGVVDGTDFRRLSGKFNLESRLSKKFRIVTNLLVGSTGQDIGDGAYAQALLARPDWRPRDALGSYTDFTSVAYTYFGLLNPVSLLDATNNSQTLSLSGSVSGIYTISEGLQFKSTGMLNLQHYNQHNYLPGYIPIYTFYGNNVNPGGIGSDANSRFADWFLENTLSYNKQLNAKNSINVVIGQSYEATKYTWFRATAAGYPNDNFLNGLSSADSVIDVAGDDPRSPQSYLLSFYARTNYSYLDKYLFTFTGRADGSSRFGPDNKFGYFPSGAVAWRISKEDFVKDLGWVNDIKIRGSYGLTGNQNIGDQRYRTLYSPGTYQGNSALIPTQLGNPGIKWESTKEADLGLDLSFFTGRLYATADYYNRQTSGSLLSLPVAPSSSYGSLLENAVGLRNRGFELSIGGEIIHTRDFKWTTALNVSRNNSLVTRLNGNADFTQIVSLSGLESVGSPNSATALNVEGSTMLLQGEPVGLISGYFVTGIIKTKAQLDAYSQQMGSIYLGNPPRIGDPMYRLDPSTAAAGFELYASNVIIGHGAPKYFGGMTQELSYKNFGLQLNFTFSEGGHLLWLEHEASTAFIGTANADVSMFNRYTPANTNATEPRLDFNTTYYAQTNLDVFSSSYIKLRSFNVHYTFNQTLWIKKAAIKNLEVFASATNVFTITKYPGSDPEISDDPYSVVGGYVDAGNYPAVRTFSLGIKASF